MPLRPYALTSACPLKKPKTPGQPALKQVNGGGRLAPPPGLEPEMPEPKSGVLPLHHGGPVLPGDDRVDQAGDVGDLHRRLLAVVACLHRASD